jgi:hypothetical protein
MDEIVALFETSQSKTTTRVCTCRSVVSHDKIPISIYGKIVYFALTSRRDCGLWKIEFFKRRTLLCCSRSRTNNDIIISYFNFFSRQSDYSFDERNISIFWNENNNITSFQFAKSRRDFIDDNKVSLMKFWFHALSNHGKGIEDEKPNE